MLAFKLELVSQNRLKPGLQQFADQPSAARFDFAAILFNFAVMNFTGQNTQFVNQAEIASHEPARLASAGLLAAITMLVMATFSLPAADLHWQHLSSSTGDLPVPGPSTQQTGAIVADLANDGTNGFVLSFRQTAPALVWYRRNAAGWDRYVIETNFLTVEAGGAVCDVDGDGHPDIIFGGDWQSDEVWWWENPYPNFDPKVSVEAALDQKRRRHAAS